MARTYSSTSSMIKQLASRIPRGTWDTHMHVVDPIAFPLDKKAQYQPAAHSLQQADSFLGELGIENMVIVQPSIYGNDNSCTLSGLRELSPKRGRAVVQFEPASTSRAQLQEWHDLGARGVRLNFKSVGASPTSAELEESLRAYAEAIRPFGWPLELYIGMENVPLLESFVINLGVKVIIAHYGHPSNDVLATATTAHEVPGFDALKRLLKGGNVWVKLSAGYRLSRDAKSPLVESLCREILRARADRCLFATDWPHTRFDGIDVAPFIENVLDCIEEEGVSLSQVLVDNAREVFDVAE
ncbi:Putative metal-dependent hydrolase [Septoria linicola]|uniref:Metal-dependent hydrolase n=1 Tax=Septoria linicola TaxID=215465 RepID=A0A9Q9AFQ0_9PEZI|nr:Putative metal-dependent hydrolase [Septoria linicola]